MDRVKALLQGTKPLKWLFYGDSITHGAVHTFGARDYCQLFEERLRFELGRKMDVVIKTAISGNRTTALLETYDWRVAQFEPDVVFLMIGMNDCSNQVVPLADFTANLHTLADRVIEDGGLPVMQTTCPILPNTSPDREPHFPAYMEAIRQVAGERKLPLIDHHAWWSEQNLNKTLNYWMSNAFHPNDKGHLAFAHLLYRELGIWDETSASCRLFLP